MASKVQRRTAPRKAKAETIKTKAKASSHNESTAKPKPKLRSSSSTSSRTIVQEQQQEDYSKLAHVYYDELARKRAAFLQYAKDLPSEDEDEDMGVMKVDKKGKGKQKETETEVKTLRERVVEAYNAAGGEPADGRWTFLVQLLRLPCTRGKYRWIAPQKQPMQAEPPSLDLKGWANEISDVLRREWKPPSGPDHEERLRSVAKRLKPDERFPGVRSSMVVLGILEKREWVKDVGALVRQWLTESTLDGLTEIRDIVEKTKLVEALEAFLQSLIPTDTYEPNRVKEVEKEQWIQHIKDFVRRWGTDSESPSRAGTSHNNNTHVSPKERKAEQIKEKVKTWQMSIYPDESSAKTAQKDLRKAREPEAVVSLGSSRSKSKKRGDEVNSGGRDPTDPSPLGFTASKPSAARLTRKGKEKATFSTRKPEDDIDMTGSDAPEHIPGPSRSKGISEIPESSFLPPSFPSSQLHHSTPNAKPNHRRPRKPSPIPAVPLSSSLPTDPSTETPFTSSPTMHMKARRTVITTVNTTTAIPAINTTVPPINTKNKRPRSRSPSTERNGTRPQKQPRINVNHHHNNNMNDPELVENPASSSSIPMDVDVDVDVPMNRSSSQNQMPPPPPTSSPLTPLPASYNAFNTPGKPGKPGKVLPTLTELLSARKAEAEALGTPGGKKVMKYSLAAVSPTKPRSKVKVKAKTEAKAKAGGEDETVGRGRGRDGDGKSGGQGGRRERKGVRGESGGGGEVDNNDEEDVVIVESAAPANMAKAKSTMTGNTASASTKPHSTSDADKHTKRISPQPAIQNALDTVAVAVAVSTDFTTDTSPPVPSTSKLVSVPGHAAAPEFSNKTQSTGTGKACGVGVGVSGSKGLETQTTVATTSVPQHQPEYTASGYAVDLNLSNFEGEGEDGGVGWGSKRRAVDGAEKGKGKGKMDEEKSKNVKPKKKKRYLGMDEVDLGSAAKSLSSLANSDEDEDEDEESEGEDELLDGGTQTQMKNGKPRRSVNDDLSLLPDFTHDEDAFAPPFMSTQPRVRARNSEGRPSRSAARRSNNDSDVDMDVLPDFTHDQDAFKPQLVSTQQRQSPHIHRRGSSTFGFDRSQEGSAQSDAYAGSPPPIFGRDGKINVRSLDEPLMSSSPVFLMDSPPKPKGKAKGKELAKTVSLSLAGGFGYFSQMDVEGSVDRVSRVLEKDVSLMGEDEEEDVDVDVDMGGWF